MPCIIVVTTPSCPCVPRGPPPLLECKWTEGRGGASVSRVAACVRGSVNVCCRLWLPVCGTGPVLPADDLLYRLQVSGTVGCPCPSIDTCLWAQRRRGRHTLWHLRVGCVDSLISLCLFPFYMTPQHWSHRCPEAKRIFISSSYLISKAVRQLFSCPTNVCWIEFTVRAVTILMNTWESVHVSSSKGELMVQTIWIRI